MSYPEPIEEEVASVVDPRPGWLVVHVEAGAPKYAPGPELMMGRVVRDPGETRYGVPDEVIFRTIDAYQLTMFGTPDFFLVKDDQVLAAVRRDR